MTFSSRHVNRSMSGNIYKNKVMHILTVQSQVTLNKGPGVSVKGMSQQPQRNIPEACVPFTHITLPSIRSWHNSPKPEFPQQPSLGSGYRLTCRAVRKVTPPVLPIPIQAHTLLRSWGDGSHLSSVLRDPKVFVFHGFTADVSWPVVTKSVL